MLTTPSPATVREARELLRTAPPTRSAGDVAADPHGRSSAPRDWRQQRPEFMTDAQRLARAAEAFIADEAMEFALAVRDNFADLFGFVVKEVRIGLPAYERRRQAAVAVGYPVRGAVADEQLEAMSAAAAIVRQPPAAESWQVVDGESTSAILAAFRRGDFAAAVAAYAAWEERRGAIRQAAGRLDSAKRTLGIKNGPAIAHSDALLPRFTDLLDRAFGRTEGARPL